MPPKAGSKKKSKAGQATLTQTVLRGSRSETRRHVPDRDVTDSESEVEDIDLLQSIKSDVSKGMRSIEKDVSNLHKHVKSIETSFEEAIEFLTKRMDELEKREEQNVRRIQALENEVKELKKVDASQSEQLNIQERFSRRNNLRIIGYPTEENENCIEITKKIMEKMGVPDVRVERAHRDGRAVNGKPRHILVKLSFYLDKVAALSKQRQALQDEQFYITDDLTKQDLQEKRKWRQQVTQLYSEGTKLRFIAGKWRGSAGKPFRFD